jgi:lysozyme
MITNAADLIKNHEGFKDRVYKDSLGYLTGGYGHAFLEGSPLSKGVCDLLFIEDLDRSIRDYDQLGLALDDVRRAACLDLLFNLGLTKLLKFKTFLKHMKAGDFDLAAAALENSLWYQQVARRGPRICALIRTGTWEVLK